MKNEHWLEAWASREARVEAPVEIERALVSGLRRRRRVRRSAAALAMLCVAAFVWGSFRLGPPPPAAPAAFTEVPRETAPQAAPPQPAAVAVPTAAPRRAVRRKAPVAVAPAPTVVESNFVAVGAWGTAEPFDRGSIVRVHVPRAALSSYGMPVSAERWNEPARADLLLGEDGTVRAVRLVSALQ